MQQCQEYKKIYQDFKTLKDKFKEGVEKIKATGKMGKDFDDLEKRLKAKMQEMRPLLEKYFLKFSWEKKEIPGFGNNILAFHPIGDNKVLVGGDKGELRILNTANNKFEKEIIGFGNHIRAFHPIGDNRILVGGNKGELRILNTANNKFEKEIPGFENYILAFHPIGDNRILVGGEGGKLRILKKELDLDNLE